MKEKITEARLKIYLQDYQVHAAKYKELRDRYYDFQLSTSTAFWNVSDNLALATARERLLAISGLICDALVDALADAPADDLAGFPAESGMCVKLKVDTDTFFESLGRFEVAQDVYLTIQHSISRNIQDDKYDDLKLKRDRVRSNRDYYAVSVARCLSTCDIYQEAFEMFKHLDYGLFLIHDSLNHSVDARECCALESKADIVNDNRLHWAVILVCFLSNFKNHISFETDDGGSGSPAPRPRASPVSSD